MCGIAGLISKHPANTDIQNHILPMVKAVSHRGPDGEGIRIFSPPELPCAVALGHKRLAVIDLTEKAAQPMCNEDRTIWIVFNGEIYNFLELRKILEHKGHIFRSSTDTEVIIHLYEDTGLDFINQLTGMFAFAILDIPSKKLILARDHTGIKPLYYWNSPHYFLFGSEIKSILASRLYSVEINWQSVYDYFTYLYPPCPQTVFQNIYHLPPAHFLIYDIEKHSLSLKQYWKVKNLPEVQNSSLPQLKQLTYDLLKTTVPTTAHK